MSRPEYDSEFCKVTYMEEDRIVLLTWKKPCDHDEYREPLFYALSLLNAFPKSAFVIDARISFEVTRDDIDWNFNYLLHSMYNLTRKQITIISDNPCANASNRNPWAGEFLKSFLVKYVASYQEAVRVNKRGLKHITNKLAGGVLIYELFMFIASFIYMIIVIILAYIKNGNMSSTEILSSGLFDKMTSSGLPYLFAIIPGIFFLFWFYRKQRLKPVMFQSRLSMSLKRFFMIFCIFMSAQGIFAVVGSGVEALLNHFGLSIMNSINAATNTSTTVSMFLYASFLAPLTEEMIFRGFILKSLEKYGKVFAIVISALLFGAMHANLIQSFFAFMIGLVLGYVAIEYSIKWTILLHFINNFVFGDLFTRLTSNLSEKTQNLIWGPMELFFFAAAVVILIIKRKEIKKYLKSNKTSKGLYKISLASAWMLVFLIFQFILSLTGITRL